MLYELYHSRTEEFTAMKLHTVEDGWYGMPDQPVALTVHVHATVKVTTAQSMIFVHVLHRSMQQVVTSAVRYPLTAPVTSME